jgi:hypothetical protein
MLTRPYLSDFIKEIPVYLKILKLHVLIYFGGKVAS